MSDVREKYVSNSTGNPFLILDCTNSFPPSLHILKVGRYTLAAIIITEKKMALKVWCHWLGLSLLCFLFFIFTFLFYIYFIFIFYFCFFLVWRFGVIDALLGRSFSLSTDWTIPGNTSLQLSASASLCITLYHSASMQNVHCASQFCASKNCRAVHRCKNVCTLCIPITMHIMYLSSDFMFLGSHEPSIVPPVPNPATRVSNRCAEVYKPSSLLWSYIADTSALCRC